MRPGPLPAATSEEAATDFELSPRTVELQENLLEFMDAHVYPAEQTWLEQVARRATRTSIRR